MYYLRIRRSAFIFPALFDACDYIRWKKEGFHFSFGIFEGQIFFSFHFF